MSLILLLETTPDSKFALPTNYATSLKATDATILATGTVTGRASANTFDNAACG